MRIYQVTHGFDMAFLERFFPTKKRAKEYAKELSEEYGEDGIHFDEHDIKPNKADICYALTEYPSR